MRTPDDWNAHYERGDTPWDLRGPSQVLRAALDLGFLAEHERVLVPGCGRGHDVLQLAQYGHDAWGVDFAAGAIAALKSAASDAGLTVVARQANIFDLFEEPAGSFDGIWEYTCFCALALADRPRYAELATHLVRPGGRLAFGVFPTLREEGPEVGPPFMVTPENLRTLFGAHWDVILDTAPTVSPPPRKGVERLMILERR